VPRLCTKFEVYRPSRSEYDALPVSALVGLVTLPLTFDKLVRIIARGVDNLLTNFGVSMMFRSRVIGQHLSDASRDLTTLTFDLGGYGAYY